MKRYIRAMAAALVLCFCLSGCGVSAPEISERAPEDTTLFTRPKTTVKEESGVPEQTDSDRSDYEESGSKLSMVDGEYNIDRLSREQERPMGGDDWTVLVYLCGTDLESEAIAAYLDIQELLSAKCADGVNIIFQTGGTNDWYDASFNELRCQRFIVGANGLELVDEKLISNMGDPSTLSDFVKWGAKNYPANNMGLIFWNHGGGSISGVCFDERFNYDSLTLSEIDKALNDSFDSMTEKFEFIGFDACLMATLETANILVPYANYMIASQESEPAGGWDYTALQSYLAYNKSADGVQLGTELGNSYYRQCEMMMSDSWATFSVVDLSKIDPLLRAFNHAAKDMYEHRKFTDVVRAVREADNFGGNNSSEGYSNMVDLGSMMAQCDKYCDNADEVISLLDEAVVYIKNGRLHSDATGLSVYYPLAVQGSYELSIFAEICPSTFYLAFVDKAAYCASGYDAYDYSDESFFGDFEDIWDIGYTGGDYSTNTDSFADYDENSTIKIEDVYFSSDTTYTVKLESMENLAFAACSVFMWSDSLGYIYLGSDDDVICDKDHRLIGDNFNGSWISLDDGQPLAIEVIDQNDDYSIYTCEIMLNGEYNNLRIEYDWNTSSWSIVGAWAGIDALTGMASRDIVALQEGDVIQPVYIYVDGENEGYITGDEYVITDATKLSYQPLPSAEYTYSITLYDIYGNWYFTPFVTFVVEEDGTLSYYPDELDDVEF